MDDLALYTPEEISKMTRGNISAYTLKRLAREKKVGCVRGERDKIMFTKQQIKELIDAWSKSPEREPVAPEVAIAFQGTSRSMRARRV